MPVPTNRAAGDTIASADINAVAALANSAVLGGSGIDSIVKTTQAAYDALATKDPATLYVVSG